MRTMFGIDGLENTEYAIAANAIVGIRDSGKTYTATEASEELFEAGIPFVWLDPIGVAHNLRIPGKGRGYPVVVAGGKHGDLPLTTKSAGATLRAAMKSGISLVIDLFSVELSKSDWRKIVRECSEILLHENGDYGLRHLFIEEAAEFVPQKPMDYDVFSAVEKLVRMGGNSKVGVTLINQRSADLNKSVLELCANVFVHRQKGKNTILDLKKWFTLLDLSDAEQKKIADSLPNLKSGECWALLNDVEKPVFLRVPEKNSLHPDRRAKSSAAEIAKRKPVPADAFVADMQAKLSKVIEETKANDPKVLHTEIKRLTAELAKANTGKPSANNTSGQVEKLNTAALAQARREGATEVQATIPAMLDAQHEHSILMGYHWALHDIRTTIKDLGIDSMPTKADMPKRKPIKGVKVTALPPSAPAPVQATRSSGIGTQPAPVNPIAANVEPAPGLSRPQQRILDALAWLESIGIDRADRPRAAMLADASHKSSGFEKNVSTLRTSGYVSYPDAGALALTKEGRAIAHKPTSAPTTAELHAAIRSHVSGPQWALLAQLCAVYPNSLTREKLAQQATVSHLSSGFEKNVSTLRSFGFVDYPEQGHVVATPVMFVGAP